MISATSRYATERVVSANVKGAVRNVIALRAPSTETFNFTYYQWADGDRPDILARAFFGDETMWWAIALANPEILVWTDLDIGTIIRIPNG